MDRCWLATADSGQESCLIIWSASTGQPVRTYFKAHTHGVIAMDMSADATYLATLGYGTHFVLFISKLESSPWCGMQTRIAHLGMDLNTRNSSSNCGSTHTRYSGRRETYSEFLK